VNNLNKKQHFLDNLGLVLIGLFSLGYVLFHKFLAERHIQFSFLDFPIFVGEILLFICLILFFAKYYNNAPKLTKWHYAIIGYFVFVVAKALYGYCTWGPLAFRHAALFYYPVFAIFGYTFYRGKFFSNKMTYLLVILIASIFIYGKFYGHWLLTLTFLGVIVIKSYSNRWTKTLVFIAFFVLIPYKTFFHTSRMMIVSNFAVGIYFAGMMPFILGGKKKIKLLIAVIIGGVVLLGLLKVGDRNTVKSIVDFKQMAKVFKFSDERIAAKADGYKTNEKRAVKLYNPDKMIGIKFGKQPSDKGRGKMNTISIEQIREKVINVIAEEIRKGSLQGKIKGDLLSIITHQVKEEIDKVFTEKAKGVETGMDFLDKNTKEIIRKVIVKKVQEEVWRDFEKNLKVDVNKNIPVNPGVAEYSNDNAVFRILIWRDMIVELIKKRPVLGFSFGKPLRSKSLEILNWGFGDWSRDGWIAAHNSYLHILYRSGIVGLLLIVSFLTLLFKMIRQFIRIKSLTGVLLCGIIINWFVAANFLLVLELPYTAIPIWTIYGLTLAYCYKPQEDNQPK